MNEHATRAWERAQLAENATDAETAWAHMFDAVKALGISLAHGEADVPRAHGRILDACAAQYRIAKQSNAPTAAGNWIDAAAVPGAQWGGKSDD